MIINRMKTIILDVYSTVMCLRLPVYRCAILSGNVTVKSASFLPTARSLEAEAVTIATQPLRTQYRQLPQLQEHQQVLSYTLCLQKMSLLWLTITVTYMNWFWSFLAEMLPRKNAIKRYFIFLPRLTSACTIWRNEARQKWHPFIQMLYCYIASFSQSQVLFIRSCYLQPLIMLLYNSLNIIVSGVKLWTVTRP